MAIKYNPYGWEIRPYETKKERIEKEKINQQKKVSYLFSLTYGMITDYLSYSNIDILSLLNHLDKLHDELERLEILRIRYENS